LCWCPSTFICSVAEDYKVDFGGLTLIGMSPLTQHRTCISGRTCSMDRFVGQYLSKHNRFMILGTCSLGTALPRFPSAGLRVSVSASGAVSPWSTTTVTAVGGLYRLCWCAGMPLACILHWTFGNHWISHLSRTNAALESSPSNYSSPRRSITPSISALFHKNPIAPSGVIGGIIISIQPKQLRQH